MNLSGKAARPLNWGRPAAADPRPGPLAGRPRRRRPRRLPPCAAVLLLAAMSLAARTPPPLQHQNRAAEPPPVTKPAPPPTVTAIEVQPAPRRTAADYQPLVVQKVHQPLDAAAVRRTIENLFATGEFAGIQAVEYAAPGGVRLVFQTHPNYFIGAVRVTHAPNPPAFAELRDATGLTLGRIYTRPEVQEAGAAILRRLRIYGYYQARVQPQVQLDSSTALANITYVLQPGPVARLGTVAFSLARAQPAGATAPPQFVPASAQASRQLWKISRLKIGEKVTRTVLDKAVRQIETYYGRHGRLAARVQIPAPQFHPKADTLTVQLRVNPGPLVSVQAEGAKISLGELHQQVPIFQEHAADAELIEEGRANLQSSLQKRGYFDASVDYRRSVTADGVLRILYIVHPGPQQSVQAVLFQGNRYFDDATLEAHVAVQTASFLPNFIPGSRGSFSRQIAQEDAESIAGLYQANGFEHVRVTPVVDRDYQGHPHHIAVIYRIQEGPQMLVGALTIAGNHAFSTAQIRNLLTLSPGEPYSPVDTVKDRDSILSLYYNAGYEQARMTVAVRPGRQPNRMDATYTIQEGQPEYVRNVFIGGERFVRRSVIARQVKIARGSPVSQLAMIQAQRRLYNLGLFTDVSVTPQNPNGIERAKNILVNVHEAQRWTFSEDVGLQVQSGTSATVNSYSKSGVPLGKIPVPDLLGGTGVSPLVGFDATRLAMFGRDQTLAFSSAYGRLEKQALLSYQLNQFAGYRSLALDLTASYADTLDVTTFRAIREVGGVQLSQQLSPTLRFTYSLDYRRIAIPNFFLPLEEVPLLGRPVTLYTGSYSLVLDHRDNPTDTHSGSYNTFAATVAKTVSSTLDNFTRFYFQNSTYYPLGRDWVLARSTRIGEILPFGPAQNVTETNPVNGDTYTTFQGVPLPERFFAGGADTLRGFSLNQAGPRDPLTGFPNGGDALLVNNVELRFPLIGANIGGVLFDDLGNVYSNFSTMLSGLTRFHEPSTTDLNYTSDAVGFGLRYNTPVGPIRLDLGYNLNPPVYQVVAPLTVNGPPVITNISLPHFNFYFSVGQTF